MYREKKYTFFTLFKFVIALMPIRAWIAFVWNESVFVEMYRIYYLCGWFHKFSLLHPSFDFKFYSSFSSGFSFSLSVSLRKPKNSIFFRSSFIYEKIPKKSHYMNWHVKKQDALTHASTQTLPFSTLRFLLRRWRHGKGWRKKLLNYLLIFSFL